MELIIRINGELDHHHADEIRKELDKRCDGSKAGTVVFDLSELTFMDSSGIGVLLGRYKKLADRRVYIQHPQPAVDKLLKMSGIYTLMPKRSEQL